jgi:hypothetical protein
MVAGGSGMSMSDSAKATEYRVGDVFQINERAREAGWIGPEFVMATAIHPWGIKAGVKFSWDQIHYIGHAALMPGDENAEAVPTGDADHA